MKQLFKPGRFLAIIFAVVFLATAVSAGQLLGTPKFQAFDSAGAPLSGGLLYTYSPGTTTDKATYSDRALSSANANPIVLDSRGEATIYLDGTTKFVLKTAAGVTIWTMDYIDGVDQTYGANRFYVDASETDQGAVGSGNSAKDFIDTAGSDNGTLVFRHTGSSATTNYTFSTSESIPANITVEIEKGALLSIDAAVTLTFASPNQIEGFPVRQIFTGSGTVAFTAAGAATPEWWGVDGTADEVQINAAITALPRGIVRLEPKQYTLAAAVNMKQNVALEGVDGSRAYGNENGGTGPSTTAYKTLLYQGTAAANGITVNGATELFSGVSIANLDIRGNSGTGKGLALLGGAAGDGIEGGEIRNVTVTGFSGVGGRGIYVDATVFRIGWYNVTAHGNTICFLATNSTYGEGAYAGTCSQMHFYNCSFRGEEDETGGTYDNVWKNEGGGTTWGFFGCDFSKAQSAAGHTAIAFENFGTGTVVNCNFEHSDIGAYFKGRHTIIGGTVGDIDADGFKFSADADKSMVLGTYFDVATANDINIESGCNDTIMAPTLASSSMTVSDSGARTMWPFEQPGLRYQSVNSSSGSVAVAMASGSYVVHTLTENTTIANPTGGKAGTFLAIKIFQSGGNSYTYSLGTSYKSNGTYPRTVTANENDQLLFISLDGTTYWEIARAEGL